MTAIPLTPYPRPDREGDDMKDSQSHRCADAQERSPLTQRLLAQLDQARHQLRQMESAARLSNGAKGGGSLSGQVAETYRFCAVAIEDAVEALSAAEPGWQPISSAPRDGSIFLGWRALWDFPQPVCWEYPVEIDDGSHSGCVGAWVYADWLMHDADFHGIEPTHWMLLPTPPVEAPTPAHAELSPGNSSDLRGEEG